MFEPIADWFGVYTVAEPEVFEFLVDLHGVRQDLQQPDEILEALEEELGITVATSNISVSFTFKGN